MEDHLKLRVQSLKMLSKFILKSSHLTAPVRALVVLEEDRALGDVPLRAPD